MWRYRPWARGTRFSWLSFLLFVPACGRPSPDATSVGEQAAGLIYGEDDRRELHEVESAEVRERVSRAVVALVPATAIDETSGAIRAQTLRERSHPCDDEPFVDQPTAAFCTGVLVDWDLILTAGHCSLPYTPAGMRAVFGWYYRAPGELAVNSDSIFEISEVVTDALDPEDESPRLDFAWMRLTTPVAAPLEPFPIALGTALRDEPLTVVGASFGLPLKVDQAAIVEDARAEAFDYFVSDSDTSHGASGGPALDSRLAVLGVLARGGDDGSITAEGCFASAHASSDDAREEFTYAGQALRALCDAGSSSTLCRAECQDPCEALPLPAHESGGCSISGRRRSSSAPTAVLTCLALSSCRPRRRRPQQKRIRRPKHGRLCQRSSGEL